MNGSNQSLEPVLKVSSLVKRYGNLLAVDQLSLQILPGEIFGLLGPNGAGKTTTIRMMCGLQTPDSGEILIGGKPLGASVNTAVRSRIGICPQENILWSKLTCFEQLVFSARIYGISSKEARRRADSLLHKMGLGSKRNSLASALSGGMKRRMNVIMAMMHDPEILVFDEPEAGLDPQSRVLVREFIRELAQQKSVIITTHNMDEADRMAHRVAIMDKGRLLQLDTPENLKKSVGEGDILVLRIMSTGSGDPERAFKKLRESGFSLQVENDQLTIRGMELVPRIHQVYSQLENEQIRITEMKMRVNTLEDVFIHLTGKSLRQ
jgi:ABC-2 type transport system ATP-binding protein